MSEQIILTLRRLVKRYPPDRTVLDGITLAFLHGAKIGVLGANGSGKSSLLRIMAGIDTHVGGDVLLAQGATVGMLEQEPQLDETRTVYENVEDGMRATRDLLDRFNAISAKLAEPLDADAMEATLAEMGEVQERIDAIDGWNLERTLATAMDALRVPPGEAEVSTLSGGERRRVALCRLLLQAPDLLLLDEPTNHLDAESVAWLERFLADYRGTVVAVTHDRYFLDNVAGWILELDRGKGIPTRATTPAGSSRSRRASSRRRRASRPAAARSRARWSGPACRRRRARPRARRGSSATSRCSPRRPTRRSTASRSTSPPAAGSGDVVVEASGLTKGFGDRLLIEDLDFSLPPGGIVGVVGPNGAGKTTLFRMIAGQEQPDGGSLRLGETVELAYVDQSRAALDGEKSVWEEITDGVDRMKLGTREVSSRAYVSSFNFRGGDQQKRVKDLSGGERNRLHLAEAAAQRRQPAAARRAHQRPRRRHAARARGRARALRRLRGGHQP